MLDVNNRLYNLVVAGRSLLYNRLIVRYWFVETQLHTKNLVNVGYKVVGNFANRPGVSHAEHVVLLLEKGQLEFEHGRQITFKPGMLMLIPAGMLHRTLAGNKVAFRWLSFCASCLDFDENASLMAPFKQVRLGALPCFVLPAGRRDYFVSLYQALEAENESLAVDAKEVAKSLLNLVLHEIKKAAKLVDEKTFSHSTTMSEALVFMQENALTNISLRDVAAAVHLSPAYFATLFKKSSGFSVGAWITQLRLSEACAQLTHTDISIEQLTYQLGWNDVTHFIRTFKKMYSITPAQWRRKNRELHRPSKIIAQIQGSDNKCSP